MKRDKIFMVNFAAIINGDYSSRFSSVNVLAENAEDAITRAKEYEAGTENQTDDDIELVLEGVEFQTQADVI